MRVLIIGAGTGGLCLAHGLRKNGVDVEVFERSIEGDDGLPGFGIHINANGARALHACLPLQNWLRFDEASAPARDVVRFHDEHLAQIVARDGDFVTDESDPVLHRRGVSRVALRDALRLGLTGPGDLVIRWGKEFVGYDRTPAGVVARFADGTTATGDVLVGADGSNSRVRRQYLPDLERLDVGVLTVAGRYALTPATEDRLPPSLTDGSVNNIVPAGPGWMFAAAWRSPRVPADAHHDDAPDTAAHDYIVWAYAAARDTFPDEVDRMSSDQLRDLVLGRMKSWSPTLRKLVADAEPGSLGPVALKSMPRLEPWPSSPVTLLGDAIHNMTPMAGVGANTALRDAGHLTVALTRAARGEQGLVAGIAEYEARMRGYANIAVGTSLRNARTAGSGDRWGRTAFRLLLRTAGAVPPIKRLMFAGAGDKD
jgi:2-polyprenyl-6-methoxyphenol hydroxylase-like FAD-dependent oxidoreductase